MTSLVLALPLTPLTPGIRLKRQMTYYSKGAGSDKLAKVKGEVEQEKGIMVENIERVLERGQSV